MLYSLFRPLLFSLSAETAHRLVFALLRVVQAIPPLRWLVAWWMTPRDPVLEVEAFGSRLTTPVGLAAGLDKDATAFDALGALGFGFVEVGTITSRPQEGNPRPRLFRLPADRALINRMGFNNAGADVVARRLDSRRHEENRRTVVGINIGKSKVVPEEEAVADYVESTGKLAAVADYVVVNVSSPNTPGLRNLQAVSVLRPLLKAVRAELDRVQPSTRTPLFVKIAPDLADEDVDAVADLALELGLDGIIATNTTLSREGLKTPRGEVEALGAGGLSGPPLRARALEVLQRLRRRVGPDMTLIASGGIDTVDDAWERIRAGASLIQVYTGFVYGGPAMVRRLSRGLAQRVREAGLSSITEAVGSATVPTSTTDTPLSPSPGHAGND